MSILAAIFGFIRVILGRLTTLALENLALRQQLAVLRRSVKRPRLRPQRMGIEQVVTARRSPWQNPYAERVIGSIRRECTDRVIAFGEEHLRLILLSYQTYYNEARTHLSLVRNSPVPRRVEPPSKGRVVAIPHLGGLHHR